MQDDPLSLSSLGLVANHHPDIAFVLTAKNGVRSHHWRFGNMPPVKGLIGTDVDVIAQYVRELQKESGIY